MNKLFKQQKKRCLTLGGSNGFTLIELMLAMSLFTFVMIIATVGFVGINRTFTKGVARKQLSESVQRLTEDITTTINNGGEVYDVDHADDSGKLKLCNKTVCYVWVPYNSASPDETVGLYKVAAGEVGEEDAKKTYIVDERYKIDYLKVDNISGTDLYRVTGIIRSADHAAFNFPSDPSKYPEVDQNIICKGSAQANASTSCALEKFSFVIRVGNGTPGGGSDS